MPKLTAKDRDAVVAQGPYYPGSRVLLSTTDTALSAPQYMVARFLHADHFVVARFKGRGQYSKTQHDTFAAACADADRDGKGLVYVVHDGTRSDLLERDDWDMFHRITKQVQQ